MNDPYTLVNSGHGVSSQTGFNASWYVFLLVLVLGAIAISLLLLMLSKNPKDWRHRSLLSDNKKIGRLKDLAESIKMSPVDNSEYAPVRILMKRLFFEKIKVLRGASDEEIQKMFQNDRVTLQKYVKDEDLLVWLSGGKKREQGIGFFPFLQDGTKRKESYLLQLNRMLDKMEDWEK